MRDPSITVNVLGREIPNDDEILDSLLKMFH